MKRFMYWLAIVISFLLTLGGFLCAFIFAITNDDLQVTQYGVFGGLATMGIGLLLMHSVEKSWSKLAHYVANIFIWA